jgi:hypothetical protein
MSGAEIEIRKLQATFLNTLAVQFVVVGVAAPIVALWLRAFGPERGPVDTLPTLHIFGMFAVAAYITHALAVERLRSLP